MAERFQVRLYNAKGLLVSIFHDWNSLYYIKTLGEPYSHQISFNDTYNGRIRSLFGTDYIIEIWRRTDRLDWYRDYTGFHRTEVRSIDRNYIFTSFGRGLNDLLRRRWILYPAVTAYTLKQAPGETVIKEFVNENCGPGAAAVMRKRSGVTYGLTIDTDLAQGTVWTGQRAWKNVLEVINEVSVASSVDFEVQRVGYTDTDFIFKTFYPQYGTDRSASVVLSPMNNNMVSPSYSLSRTEEANIVAVLGQDEGLARKVVIVQNATDATASPWNDIECCKDARNEATYLGMVQDGSEYLNEVQKKETFDFEIPYVPDFEYGIEYNLGDLVLANMEEIDRIKKIVSVETTVSEGKIDRRAKVSDISR